MSDRVVKYIRDGAPAVGGATLAAMVQEYVHTHWGGSYSDARVHLEDLAGLNSAQEDRLSRALDELNHQRHQAASFKGEPASAQPASQVEQDGVWVVLRRGHDGVAHISSIWRNEAEAAEVAALSFDLKASFVAYGEH